MIDEYLIVPFNCNDLFCMVGTLLVNKIARDLRTVSNRNIFAIGVVRKNFLPGSYDRYRGCT